MDLLSEKEKNDFLWQCSLDQCRNISIVLVANQLDPEAFFEICLRKAKEGKKIIFKKAVEQGKAAQKH